MKINIFRKYRIVLVLLLFVIAMVLPAESAIPPKKMVLDRGVVTPLQWQITAEHMKWNIDQAFSDGFPYIIVGHFDPVYIDNVRNHGARDYLKEAFPYAAEKGVKIMLSFNFNKYSGGDRDKFRVTPADQAKYYDDLDWTFRNYPDIVGMDLEELQANYDITISNPTQLKNWQDFVVELSTKSTAIVKKYKDTSSADKFMWSGSCASSVYTCKNVGFDVERLDNLKLFNTFTVENNKNNTESYNDFFDAWEKGTKNEVIRASTYVTWSSLSTNNPKCDPIWEVAACYNQGFFQILDNAIHNERNVAVFTLGYLNYGRHLFPNDQTPGNNGHEKVHYIFEHSDRRNILRDETVFPPASSPTAKVTSTTVPPTPTPQPPEPPVSIWILIGVASVLIGRAIYQIQHNNTQKGKSRKALVIAQEIGDRREEEADFGDLGNAYRDLGQVEKAIEYYRKALAIAQEIGDRRGEGLWLNNLGLAFQNEKKHIDALACYLLAKKIRIEIKDPHITTTELNLSKLKEELGEKEFEKLESWSAPRAEEMVRKILESSA